MQHNIPGDQVIGLLLLPQFSLLGLGAATSVLAGANDLAGRAHYQPRLLGLQAGEVVARCGTRVAVEAVAEAGRECHALLLCVDRWPQPAELAACVEAVSAFRRAAPSAAVLGGSGLAALVLGACGLLDGRRAAVGWQHAAEVAERHPQAIVSSNVFEHDGACLTCGGGATMLDMLLHWVGLGHGAAFAAELAVALGIERARAADERQPLPAAAQPTVASARIAEALALMEANLGEPLQTEDIARLVGISRRQLERLFRQHLGTLPSRHYLELRLKQARHQLRHTSHSIMQIGLACGFASGPHFSTAYRAHFGHTPREERARRQMPQGAAAPTGVPSP